MEPFRTIQYQAAALLIYQSVLTDEVGTAYLKLLEAIGNINPDPNSEIACLRAYGAWFHWLASLDRSWQSHLVNQILQSENPFTQQAQQRDFQNLAPSLIAAAQHDLAILQQLYNCDETQVGTWLQEYLPSSSPVVWQQSHQTTLLDEFDRWSDAVKSLSEYHCQNGIGDFTIYRAFRWSHQLEGITYPDLVQIEDLVGYDLPRELLIKNTEALLSDKPALHVLLYGSRGSGKSSLVKSLLAKYQKLRLVEVTKADLIDLPQIVDRLRSSPLKFIIFVDDLSFEEDENAYKALKVVLEGNLTARSQNTVIYATSNRRHLIREFYSDRPRPSDADEIHAWDTVQEKLSLSDRFGLTLTFEPADQNTYLQIVRHLAMRSNIQLTPEELEFQALQWATRRNGRSGRTARQFIDFLLNTTPSV